MLLFIVVSAFIGVWGLSSQALATEARVDALQVERWIKDDTNIYRNPALLTNYPNEVLIEYGESAGDKEDLATAPVNRYGGANFAAGNAVLGLYMGRYSSLANYAIVEKDTELNNPFEFLGAFKLTGDSSLGFSLYFANNNTDGTTGNADYVDKATDLEFAIGTSIQNHTELSLRVGLLNTELAHSDVASLKGDYTNFDLNYRGTFPVSSLVSLVPTANLRIMQGDMKLDGNGSLSGFTGYEDTSTIRFGLGCAARYETEQTLLAAALEIITYKEESDPSGSAKGEEITANGLLFYTGLEQKISEHFWGRIGIQNILFAEQKTEDKDADTELVETLSTSDDDFLAVGFGYKKDSFCLDFTLMDSLPYNGGYLFSGKKGDWLSKISATYSF